MHQKLNQQGFARWTVLAAIGLAGGAIALLPGFFTCHQRKPGFTRCVDHAANLSFEGRRTFRAVMRSQQAYYLEHQNFSAATTDVNPGDRSPNFEYSSEVAPSLFLFYGIPKQPEAPVRVRFQGLSWIEKYPVRSAVLAIAPSGAPNTLPTAIVCENLESGVLKPTPPALQNGRLVCAPTTQQVNP